MTYADIQNRLLAFNSDQETQAIRDFYTKKSFLEILSKSRNETTHSAFLAWLLQGDAFPKGDAPLMRFLNVLVKNSDGIDSPTRTDDSLKAAILSGTLECADVKVTLEQTVKEISTIPSKDRLDLYLTATLNKPVNGKKNLRIVVENKIFSEEIKAADKVRYIATAGMDSLTKEEFNGKDAYLKLNQTQRYYFAVVENPKDVAYNDDTFSLFVFLTPSGKRATDNHFIPVTYQDLMDFVLEPLAGNAVLDANTRIYLQEYINALSVPSISDTDNELTVLAVSKSERKRLEKFWHKYEDIITEAAKSNQVKAPTPEDFVLQKFYEKNQPLFIAIYHIMPDKAAVLKPFTTRDYTKYTLKFNGNIIGEHLGKRAVVLLAAKTLIENNSGLPDVDKYNRAFFYNEQEFEDRHNQGLMSDDAYNNRYTMIETKQGKFAICNQWGSGNWDFVEEWLSSNWIELIYE